MNRFSLSRGANAIVIAYVRKNGGKCLIHSTNLARENNLTPATISVALQALHSRGFIRLEKNFRNQPAMVTLNEDAIKQYENGAPAVSGGHKTSSSPKTCRSQPFGGIPQEVAKLLQILEGHTFANIEHVKPLFETAGVFYSKYAVLASMLELRQTEIAKLEEALKGLGMNEDEIRESLGVTAEEIAGGVEYEELPVVPVVDFTSRMIINEPANIFKPLALLQVKTRILRNLLIEIQRETSRMDLLRQKLSVLLKEKQEAEVGEDEVMANFRSWQHQTAKYFRPVDATVVVASKE